MLEGPLPVFRSRRGALFLSLGLSLSPQLAACGGTQRGASASIAAETEKPKLPPLEANRPTTALTVLLSIDQLRADLPVKLLPRFGKGGFRRLYEEGVVYDTAAYAHSATETAVS